MLSYRFHSFLFLLLPLSLNGAEHGLKKVVTHSLEDERLQTVLSHRTNMQMVGEFLRPTQNQKLTLTQMIFSLTDQNTIPITRGIYVKLMGICMLQINNIYDENLHTDRIPNTDILKNLHIYLQEGLEYRTIQAIPLYYTPLIMLVSQRVIGNCLPKELCKIIISSIDTLPNDAACSISKTEALIMLRYASYAAHLMGVNCKEYYNFPPVLDALW